MSKLVSLTFTPSARGGYDSQPVTIGGNFSLHLEFDSETRHDNEVAVRRSTIGTGHTTCYRTDFNGLIYDRSFGDAISGLSIVIHTRNEPQNGVMLCEGLE